MNIEELPKIENGTPKQQIFAEGVRLSFLTFVEESLDPKYYEDAELVVKVRVHYKWWIDQAKKIDEKSIKLMIRSAKASITRHGSIEDALEAQRETLRKAAQKYQEYLERQEAWYADDDIEEEISMGGLRERPF